MPTVRSLLDVCCGWTERVENGVKERAASRAKVRVTAKEERKYSVWMGGAVLSSLSTFAQQWITTDEYNEHGPSIVHRKCIS